MLRNYTTLTDLKAYIPNLDNLLWTENEDYSAQIEAAEREVRDDLLNTGLRGLLLRPDLTLNAGTSAITTATSSDAVNETFQRQRWIVNVTAQSAASVTFTLQGCDTETGTYVTVSTITSTGTGLQSELIPKPYDYYKLSTAISSGSVTVESYLTETVFDTLFIYKTLILILTSMVMTSGDQWDLKRQFFSNEYSRLLTTAKMAYDADQDGNIEMGEVVNNNVITYYK